MGFAIINGPNGIIPSYYNDIRCVLRTTAQLIIIARTSITYFFIRSNIAISIFIIETELHFIVILANLARSNCRNTVTGRY